MNDLDLMDVDFSEPLFIWWHNRSLGGKGWTPI